MGMMNGLYNGTKPCIRRQHVLLAKRQESFNTNTSNLWLNAIFTNSEFISGPVIQLIQYLLLSFLPVGTHSSDKS